MRNIFKTVSECMTHSTIREIAGKNERCYPVDSKIKICSGVFPGYYIRYYGCYIANVKDDFTITNYVPGRCNREDDDIISKNLEKYFTIPVKENTEYFSKRADIFMAGVKLKDCKPKETLGHKPSKLTTNKSEGMGNLFDTIE